jgi:hypothetical protein
MMALLDRARRVLFGTSLEHLEQVPRRIRGGIIREKRGLGGIWDTSSILTRDSRNLMVPLDRARRVVLGT